MSTFAIAMFTFRLEGYEEPKKLVALGLANTTAKQVGQRSRTSYSITAKGRRALDAWVPTPRSRPSRR